MESWRRGACVSDEPSFSAIAKRQLTSYFSQRDFFLRDF
jgi:hypothetical protein